MSTSSPSDRKRELEAKKARLAAIREEKRRREESRRRDLLDSGHSAGSDLRPDHSPARPSDVRREAEDILKDLEDKGVIPASPAQGAPGDGQNNDTSSDATASAACPSEPIESADGSGSPSKDSPAPHMVYKSRGMVNLQRTDTSAINFAPKENVLYCKTTQTMGPPPEMTMEHPGLHGQNTFDWDDEFGAMPSGGMTGDDMFPFDESPTTPGAHAVLQRLPTIDLVRPADLRIGEESKPKEPEKPRELPEDEKRRIMASEPFQNFIDRAATVMERALAEEVNIFDNYGLGPEDQEDRGDVTARLSLHRTFFDDKWTKGRLVTGLDWNAQHPELIGGGYSRNPDVINDPDGVVVVWNSKFKKDTPEYVFHCQSRVCSVAFAKFHPNLILAGTYSGQVCLWDNRYAKKTPVQKSPMSTKAHTHPVFCMEVVGTQNAHNLVTISTDGRMCSWSLDMLAQPQDSVDLTPKQSKQVAAMSMSFLQNDVNNLYVGSEDGCVYSACRHGTKQGVTDIYEGHCAPVTGIHCHRATGSVDFSHLFLTSSFDWTVKLWSTKEQKPLYSFEDHQSYVMDVAWSPVNPALFACVDATGRLDLWNLNQDTEVPAASVVVGENLALNKVLWMQNGQSLAVADDTGRIYLYDVNEAVAAPRQEDWSRLARQLHELQLSQSERDELSNMGGGISGYTSSY